MLIPTGSRVIIEPDAKPEEERSAGGIIMPQVRWSLHPDVTKAKVIALGSRCTGNIKVGMNIIISRLAGVKIEAEDKKYLMVDEEDIIGIMED